jgi:hypothetical protein
LFETPGKSMNLAIHSKLKEKEDNLLHRIEYEENRDEMIPFQPNGPDITFNKYRFDDSRQEHIRSKNERILNK